MKLSKEKMYELAFVSLSNKFVARANKRLTGEIYKFEAKNNLELEGFSNVAYQTTAEDYTIGNKNHLAMIEKAGINLLSNNSLSILTGTEFGDMFGKEFNTELTKAERTMGPFEAIFNTFKEQFIKSGMFTFSAQEQLFENLSENMTALYEESVLSKNFVNGIVNDMFAEKEFDIEEVSTKDAKNVFTDEQISQALNNN